MISIEGCHDADTGKRVSVKPGETKVFCIHCKKWGLHNDKKDPLDIPFAKWSQDGKSEPLFRTRKSIFKIWKLNLYAYVEVWAENSVFKLSGFGFGWVEENEDKKTTK